MTPFYKKREGCAGDIATAVGGSYPLPAKVGLEFV